MLSIHYSMSILYGQWHIFIDEIGFYSDNEKVSVLVREGSNLLDVFTIFKYSEMALYVYVQGCLVLLANFFDHFSVLTQKLFNIYITALIPTILFYLLANYVSKKEAFFASLMYGLLTFNLAFSFTLIRDGLGAFLYIMIFYYYLLPSSNRNFIFILLFAFLSYFLRPETGMYALLIASSYIYFQYASLVRNKYFILFIVIFVLLPLIFLLIYKFHAIEIMNNLMDRSSARGMLRASSGSLGAALLNLPIYIKLPLKFIHGQIAYFPPWSVFHHSDFRELIFFRFSGFIASIFWFFVWPFILVGIFKDKVFNRFKNKKIFVLFALSIAFIALSSLVESNPRRLMYVYPVLFLIATVSYTDMERIRRKRIIRSTTLVYLLLIGLYISLKYLR